MSEAPRPPSPEPAPRSVQEPKQDQQTAELMEENKRLKVALEELRAKLGEMGTEVKKTPGVSSEHVDKIVEVTGLKQVIKARSVFESLYKDALLRVERLEKLRERYRQERQKMLGLGEHPQAAQNEQAQQQYNGSAPVRSGKGVLEAVQESRLVEDMNL